MRRILAISLILASLAGLLLSTTPTDAQTRRRNQRNRQSRNLRRIDPTTITAPTVAPPRRQRRAAAPGNVGSESSPLVNNPFVWGSYYVRLDAYTIFNTRSRDDDTNYVSFALKVGDTTYPAQVKRMGDQDNGDYHLNMVFGPFEVYSPSTQVSFTYQILNSGYRDTSQMEAALKNATEAAVKQTNIPEPWGSIVRFIVGELGGAAFANCDGPVAGETITVDGNILNAWAPRPGLKHQETRDYYGADSPSGCGSNSHYNVTWSVIRGTPQRPPDRPSSQPVPVPRGGFRAWTMDSGCNADICSILVTRYEGDYCVARQALVTVNRGASALESARALETACIQAGIITYRDGNTVRVYDEQNGCGNPYVQIDRSIDASFQDGRIE